MPIFISTSLRNPQIFNPAVRFIGTGPVSAPEIPPLPEGPLFDVIEMTPVASNTFRVFVSAEPQDTGAAGMTSFLNRLNWTISVQSGVATTPVITRIQNIRPAPEVASITNPNPWSVDVLVDRRIQLNAAYQLTIGPNARSVLNGAVTPANNSAEAAGDAIIRPRQRVRSAVVTPGVDFFYSTFGEGGVSPGAYVIDPKGDIDVHAGEAALKKRIIRRLLTTPGGFYHLPSYGAGLVLKRPIRTTDLNELQREIREQVTQEEDVSAVEVNLSRPTPSLLIVQLRVSTQQQRRVLLQLDVPESGDISIVA